MGKIHILDESISNIIAAGEVVENPASLLKELVENSLDAGSTTIKIIVKNSGRNITLIDNGSGMSKDDVLLSIERHATSKIATKDDIFALETYGFRGEALASIAAVSRFSLYSRVEGTTSGTSLMALGGKVTKYQEEPGEYGTTIKIKDLFFNTPARLKFLRKKGTEYTKIKDIVLKEALANHKVAFNLTLDDREVIKTSGSDLENTILELFNKNTLRNIKEFDYGFLGNMKLLKSSKHHIYTYVNGRYVKSQIIEKAIIDAYYTKLSNHRYPFVIVFLEVNPQEVDVNVHPSKKIVKFSSEGGIYQQIYEAASTSLKEADAFLPKEENLDFLEEFLKTTEAKNSENDEIINSDEYSKKNQPSKNNLVDSNLEIKHENRGDKIVEDSSYNHPSTPLPSLDSNTPSKVALNVSEFNGGSSNKASTSHKYHESSDSYDYLNHNIKESKGVKTPEAKGLIPTSTLDYRIIGQFNKTYILVERNGVLEIYDQHIVHERTLYERLKNSFKDKNISRQGLLVPIRMDIDHNDYHIISEYLDIFLNFGFEVEFFGEKEILIRSTPVFDFRSSVENTFLDILERLKSQKNIEPREAIIVSMSCRNAIKANKELTINEMEKILSDLFSLGEVTCPHGRPIFLKFPLNELEKRFKRR